MAPIKYRPHWHLLYNIPFANYLREHFGDEKLFSYKHAQSKNWIIAVWLKPKELMLELLLLGKEPHGSRALVRKLELKVRGNAHAEANKRHNKELLNGWDRRHMQEMENDQEAELGVLRHLRARDNMVNRERRLPYKILGDEGTKVSVGV